jgi:hypothetical protein
MFAKVGPVELEEVLQQVPIGDRLRIEGDLDRLGVAEIILLKFGRVTPQKTVGSRLWQGSLTASTRSS